MSLPKLHLETTIPSALTAPPGIFDRGHRDLFQRKSPRATYTSAIGGYFDDEWKDTTQELWRQTEAGQYRFLTSAATVDEVATAPEPGIFADPAAANRRRG
jgi:hypothetical protein